MADLVLADAGPLVAFLDRNDPAYAWSCAQIRGFTGPMFTCEAVLSECAHLTEHSDPGNQQLLALLRTGGLRISYTLKHDFDAVGTLMAKYSDVANACLVRMTELHDRARVFTLDSDFRRYRRHSRQTIPLISPA
jgi:predicted nucleic acid-binding protein